MDLQSGPLVLWKKSHLLRNYESLSENYEELPAAFDESVAESDWISGKMQQGDAIIFDIKTVHGSLKNKADVFRVSCDTRWMPLRIARKYDLQ